MEYRILTIGDCQMRSVVNRAQGVVQFELCEAGCNEDGLRAAEQLKPDLIVLDVRIPNGRQFCQSLKGNPDTAAISVLVVALNGGGILL